MLAITSGEPAGIGPELIVKLAQKERTQDWVVLADIELMYQRAEQLGLPLHIHEYQLGESITRDAQALSVFHCPLAEPCIAGELNVANAPYVLDLLKTAHDWCMNGDADAIVTGPIHKGVINESGLVFSGHTEYFQEHAGVDKVVMMLATPGLRVALATTHLPLRDVADAITPESLEQVMRILHHDLVKAFGIEQPKVLVTGLNPHAGEDGHMGDEEIRVINPVIQTLKAEGMQFSDALPADTLFTPYYLEKADAVLAMYHDQGLPVLKHKGFGNAVNITLGLPYIRTSVDHGTALNLAGTGEANTGSFEYALTVAQEMIDAGR